MHMIRNQSLSIKGWYWFCAELLKIVLVGQGLKRGSKFSSHEIALRNRVTQNDVALRVTKSKTSSEILLLSYKLDVIKYYFNLWVTNSKV